MVLQIILEDLIIIFHKKPINSLCVPFIEADSKSMRTRNSSARPKILIVDDDVRLRSVLEQALLDKFNVVLMPSGVDALQYIDADNPIDALLTDFDLGGGIDGFDVAKALRQKHPHVPIILMTGSSRNEPRINAVLSLTIADILEKPFERAALFLKLQLFLEQAA